MKVSSLLLVGLLVGCVGAASSGRPSPAGLTTIVVRGDARDVVLVDPLGRISRSHELETDVLIPHCDRDDGGTETLLDDSTETNATPRTDVVVQLELSKPIVGRYRLVAEAIDSGSMTAVVTLPRYEGTVVPCNEIRSDIQKGSGYYYWNIDFLPDSSRGTCPVGVSRPMRPLSTTLRKLGLAPKVKGS
jgi:hypothetical protein